MGKVKEPGVLEEVIPCPQRRAVVLADLRRPYPVDRRASRVAARGRYNVARLMEKYGDAKLPDLLQTLANCPKARSVSIYDRCKAVFEGLTV